MKLEKMLKNKLKIDSSIPIEIKKLSGGSNE